MVASLGDDDLPASDRPGGAEVIFAAKGSGRLPIMIPTGWPNAWKWERQESWRMTVNQ